MRLLLGAEPVIDAAIDRHRGAYRTFEQLRTAFMCTADARFLFIQANKRSAQVDNELSPLVQLTPRDWVICGYVLLLGREPESESVITRCIEVSSDDSGFSSERLRLFLMGSQEFREVLHARTAHGPDADPSPNGAVHKAGDKV